MDAALRSNAVFLLGAYLLLVEQYTLDRCVCERVIDRCVCEREIYLLLVERYTLDRSLYHSEIAEFSTLSLLPSLVL